MGSGRPLKAEWNGVSCLAGHFSKSERSGAPGLIETFDVTAVEQAGSQ